MATKIDEYVKLPVDGRPQPEKGANPDPLTWKVVRMRDDPSKFKVVDDSQPENINVADLFVSESTAQQYIDHFAWIKEHPCLPGLVHDKETGECVEPPTSTDKIYPDTDPPHICTNVSDGDREQGGDRREPQIACGFNFLNTEATVYINTHDINDTLSIKLRGPKHSDPTPESDMCNNIHYVNLGDEDKKPFGKQAGHTAEYCEFGSPVVKVPDNTWVGVKAIEWNESNGVHFQTWIENPEGSGWKLAADIIDTGGLGSCSGPASDPYTTSPCAGSRPVSIGFRVDGLNENDGDVEFKNMSVREIQPPGETPLPDT